MSEIEKFDPASVMDNVKNKIKSAFVDLIPEAQWMQMVETASDQFFKPRRVNEGNSSYPKWVDGPSEFDALVLDEMRIKAKEYIQAIFDDPKYQIKDVWMTNPITGNQDNKVQVSEYLDAKIKEAMPDMLSTMFGSIISNGMKSMFSQFQNQITQNFNHTY